MVLETNINDRQADALTAIKGYLPPPWCALTPRQLADLTGWTVQSLANWRYRNNGPRFTQSKRSRACSYRPCDVLEWMTGTPAWRYNRDWLLKHGLIPEDATEEHVSWVCSLYKQVA